MATAFDSIGMGMLGGERQFMSASNPFKEGIKGLKDFAILSAMDKSGLAEYLNELGKQKEDIQNKYKPVTRAAEPYTIKPIMAISPESYTAPYQQQAPTQPVLGQTAPYKAQPSMSIEDAANDAMGLSKSSSFVSPNVLPQNNQAESQSVLDRASQPAVPPGMMNLPQYAQSGDGGGINPLSVLSTLATFFG